MRTRVGGIIERLRGNIRGAIDRVRGNRQAASRTRGRSY